MSDENPSREKACVALIGLRGCGKSVVGRLLASARRCDHVDTDQLIVERAGLTISEIFAQQGEEAFRAIEHDVVAQIPCDSHIVVSLGGGAILDQRNIQHLQPFSTIVWLKTPTEVLAKRIDSDPESGRMRPALTEKCLLEEIRQLAQEREPLYEQAADWSVGTARRSPRQVADYIQSRLG